ncbi:MAG: hypothetical protein H7239_09270 [Flavobacterium sp.]|nr:hypothetical protein [Flavobacterium sp.]
MARHSRVKICKDVVQTAPDNGFCASQNSWFYGYKLHGVCVVSGVFQSIDITKEIVHDVHLFKYFKYRKAGCAALRQKLFVFKIIISFV